jgi:hypothetical protein
MSRRPTLTERRPDVAANARLVRALRRVLGEIDHAPARNLTEQIAYLERDVQEVRTRVNALFFTVITTALAQLVARFFA